MGLRNQNKCANDGMIARGKCGLQKGNLCDAKGIAQCQKPENNICLPFSSFDVNCPSRPIRAASCSLSFKGWRNWTVKKKNCRWTLKMWLADMVMKSNRFPHTAYSCSDFNLLFWLFIRWNLSCEMAFHCHSKQISYYITLAQCVGNWVKLRWTFQISFKSNRKFGKQPARTWMRQTSSPVVRFLFDVNMFKFLLLL